MNEAIRPGDFGSRRISIDTVGGTTITITLDIGEVERCAARAFQYANETLLQRAQQQARRDLWEWPNTTVRRKGKKVVGSPRNIIDTGGFFSSIMEKQEADNPLSWLHTVEVDYAVPVILGYRVRTKDGWRNMPGRNIYRAPLEKDFARAFFAQLRRELLALPPS